VRRLLIVEDERWEREGLAEFIDWPAFGIGEILGAENGRDGLRLAELHRPDIVLTDIKMPKMDGLQFGTALRRILPECVIVVISGYDDFSFAKQAISFGVYDYLLKPIQKENLMELMARVVVELDLRRSRQETEEVLKARLSEGVQEKRERLLRDMLAGRAEPVSGLGLVEELDATIFRRGIVVAAMKADLSRYIGDADSAAREARSETLYRSARRVVGEAGVVVPCHNAMCEIALCLPAGGRDAVSETLERLRRECGGHCANDLAVGVGEPRAGVEAFLESFAEAGVALDRLFLEDSAAIVFHVELLPRIPSGVGGRSDGALVADPQEALLRRLTSHEASADSFYAAELFDYVRTRGLDRSGIRAYFSGLLGRLALLADSDAALLSRFSLAGAELPETMDSFVRLRYLEDWFLSIARAAIEGIAERTSRREARVAEEAMDIIRTEYADNIGISIIADRMGLSANYLGSVFRQRAGKPFTRALTEYRVARADELLAAGELTIGEVARAVGFRNSGYFASVYRRLRGFPPSGRQGEGASEERA
jgi:two-component system, response regulator YesN